MRSASQADLQSKHAGTKLLNSRSARRRRPTTTRVATGNSLVTNQQSHQPGVPVSDFSAIFPILNRPFFMRVALRLAAVMLVVAPCMSFAATARENYEKNCQ